MKVYEMDRTNEGYQREGKVDIETVRQKFESDLCELKKVVEKGNGLLARDIIGTIEEVILEYENGYVYHIDELISEKESLLARVEELERELRAKVKPKSN